MDYGEVFSRTWKIIWKFKILWVFGILSSCGSGGGGGGGGGNTGFQFSRSDVDIPPGMRGFFNSAETFFYNIQGWEIAALIVGVLLLALVMILITSVISTVGEIGLIQGTRKAEDGAERMTFSELFADGKPFFWRVFGFNILASLALLVIVLIFVLPIIGVGAATKGIGLFCLVPLLCLLIPASWLIGILIKQIILTMVIEDLKIKESILRGWDFFRGNIGKLLLMGLVLGVGSAIISLILAAPLIAISIPAVIGIVGGSISGSGAVAISGVVAALIGFLILTPAMIILGGILQAYVKTAWTLTYLRLTRTPDVSMDTINLSPDEM
jgi:hypothetical protein